MAFVLINLLAPCGFDGLDMRQVARFTSQVALVCGTVLDDYDSLEVDTRVLYPFLYGFFADRVK